jgi:WD40 repeat protein
MQRSLAFDLQNSNALSIDYYRGLDSSKTIMVFSNDAGYVNVLTLDEDELSKYCIQQQNTVEYVLIEKDGQTKLKHIGILSKRKAHNDWVMKTRYIAEFSMIISCSPDEKSSLVVAKTDKAQNVTIDSVGIPKGARTFAFSKVPLFIVTGGLDRELRLWNPLNLDCSLASLSGHYAPIVDITINEVHGQIISLSTDKVVKIWDSRRLVCLQSISSTWREFPENMLSAVLFVAEQGGKLITSSSVPYQYMFRENMESEVTVEPKSHEHPIRCLKSNPTFGQVISGCDGGIITVWVNMD